MLSKLKEMETVLTWLRDSPDQKDDIPIITMQERCVVRKAAKALEAKRTLSKWLKKFSQKVLSTFLKAT